MLKITERQRLDIEDVFRHPGWKYFENEFLRDLITSLIADIGDVPVGIDGLIQREQNIGKINLSKEIVDTFKIQIENHTKQDESN